MKHLIKIITVATAAALTISCVSVLAKGGKHKAGQETAPPQFNFEEKKADRCKDKANRPEMTEEQKAEMVEKAKAMLEKKLADGKLTQEEYDAELAKIESGDFRPGHWGGKDKAKRPEMTEEQKAEMVEKAKAMLEKKLADGKLTQEEYDAELAKIESGDFRPGFGKGNFKHMPHDKAKNEPTAE